MSNNQKYIESELLSICPLPVSHYERGQFKIQIIGPSGRTKWIDVTPDQFKDIEAILFLGACHA